MRTSFYVTATPNGLDLKVGKEADLPDLGAVLITFDVPVSRLIDRIPELRELVSTLTRELDEARAKVEKLRAQSEQRRAALERLNNIYRSEYEEPGPNPPWLAAALAGEWEDPTQEWGACNNAPHTVAAPKSTGTTNNEG